MLISLFVPLGCRQRLGRVVAPVLRLVLLVLANAPGSESVRADAEAFVARHLVLFQRLLREVVMPGESAAGLRIALHSPCRSRAPLPVWCSCV
jgi:hypothetical protein